MPFLDFLAQLPQLNGMFGATPKTPDVNNPEEWMGSGAFTNPQVAAEPKTNWAALAKSLGQNMEMPEQAEQAPLPPVSFQENYIYTPPKQEFKAMNPYASLRGGMVDALRSKE